MVPLLKTNVNPTSASEQKVLLLLIVENSLRMFRSQKTRRGYCGRPNGFCLLEKMLAPYKGSGSSEPITIYLTPKIGFSCQKRGKIQKHVKKASIDPLSMPLYGKAPMTRARSRRRLAKFLTSLVNSQQRRAGYDKALGLKQSDSAKYQFECKVIETLPLIVSFKGNVQS
jgi:hypothetical protein